MEGGVVLRGITKVLAGAGLTALASFGASRALGALVDTDSVIGQLVQTAGSVAAGLLVFLAAALILRMEDLQLVKELVVSRVRPRPESGP